VSPFTVYLNEAWLPSAKVSVVEPTTVSTFFAGSKGVALNAGPVTVDTSPA